MNGIKNMDFIKSAPFLLDFNDPIANEILNTLKLNTNWLDTP